MPRKFEVIRPHMNGEAGLNIDNIVYTEREVREALNHENQPNNISGYTNDGGQDDLLGRVNYLEGQIKSLWATVEDLQRGHR